MGGDECISEGGIGQGYGKRISVSYRIGKTVMCHDGVHFPRVQLNRMTAPKREHGHHMC